MKNKLMFVFLAMVSGLFVGCSSDDNNEVAKPEFEKQVALVELEVINIEENQATVAVFAKNVEKLMYLCVPKGDAVLTQEEVVSKGKALTIKDSQEFAVNELEANTEYEVAVVGVVDNKTAIFKSKTFTTLERIVDDVLVLKDGFLKYDELDEASGYYRTNIILSSDVMKENGSNGQIDVLIWLYTSYPLEKGQEKNRFNIPFGVATPFFTNGVGLTDMMYYIGKHKKEANGEPNFEGTAWVEIDDKGKDTYFVADDTKNTKIEVKDNKDGSYTIHGVLVDQTKNTELKFTYTDNKAVFGIW